MRHQILVNRENKNMESSKNGEPTQKKASRVQTQRNFNS